MRELRFVTRADDGSLVVEQLDRSESFRLPVDDALRAAVAGALPVGSSGTAPAASSVPQPPAPNVQHDAISPRDIQIRVRAGESPQSLADEHGVPLERVMRFAGPVLAERLRITDEARRARARRTGHDDAEPRVVVFGEAVDERFAVYGVEVTGVEWDSRRREDGEWIIVASWVGGDGTHDAHWLFHRASRTATPLDDAAADLLSDRPVRPVAPPVPEPLHLAAPPLTPGVIAFPPFPDAHTGPIQRVEEVFDQEDTRDLPRVLAPLASDGFDFDEPPLPLAISEGEGRPAAASSPLRSVVAARGESDEEKASRARIPSWDDILLGVRRKDD